MKKTFLLALCLSGLSSFAQNGFFIQPEIGGGISNTCWQPFSTKPLPEQSNVPSYQAQLDIGYKAGKWQFISGIGYLRTGVTQLNSSIYAYENTFFPADAHSGKITDYNPHLVVPVKVGYQVSAPNKKLNFTPLLGTEFACNMDRTFVLNDQLKETESQHSFKSCGNRFGLLGLLQLNIGYNINERIGIAVGPSVQYMFTSLVNFAGQHDYSLLMNACLKYNINSKKLKTGKAISGQHDSLKS